MSRNRGRFGGVGLGLVLGFSVLLAGCATQPLGTTARSYRLAEVAGTWSWTQEDQYHGDFVLTQEGDACTGTLNDVGEGTYGDKIADVAVADNRITFTRTGKFGVQHWEGTLKREDNVLKIVDGRFTKEGGYSGPFHAEKQK